MQVPTLVQFTVPPWTEAEAKAETESPTGGGGVKIARWLTEHAETPGLGGAILDEWAAGNAKVRLPLLSAPSYSSFSTGPWLVDFMLLLVSTYGCVYN